MNRQRQLSTVHPVLALGRAGTIVYMLFVGLPIVALLVVAAGQERFAGSLTSSTATQALKLSAATSTVSLAVIVLLGTPLAYLLARRQSPFLRIVDSLIELPVVLPPVVAGVAMLMAFGRQGLLGPPLEGVGVVIPFTTTAVLFAQTFVSAPFYIRAARIGFQGVRADLEDVSQTLGVSPWSTFWRLTLPLAWPALVGGAALAWARALSEFGATIMFAGNLAGHTQTMPLAILSAMESDIPAALALSVVLTLVALLLLLGLGIIARLGYRGRP